MSWQCSLSKNDLTSKKSTKGTTRQVICWIIIKEGPGNFSGGRSPHWVNHVNLCLYCIVYLLCFVSAFVLFYCSIVLFFLTTGIRAKGNS
jgi:hypothetical protein